MASARAWMLVATLVVGCGGDDDDLHPVCADCDGVCVQRYQSDVCQAETPSTVVCVPVAPAEVCPALSCSTACAMYYCGNTYGCMFPCAAARAAGVEYECGGIGARERSHATIVR